MLIHPQDVDGPLMSRDLLRDRRRLRKLRHADHRSGEAEHSSAGHDPERVDALRDQQRQRRDRDADRERTVERVAS